MVNVVDYIVATVAVMSAGTSVCARTRRRLLL